jgi:hypothetical protein
MLHEETRTFTLSSESITHDLPPRIYARLMLGTTVPVAAGARVAVKVLPKE